MSNWKFNRAKLSESHLPGLIRRNR